MVSFSLLRDARVTGKLCRLALAVSCSLSGGQFPGDHFEDRDVMDMDSSGIGGLRNETSKAEPDAA